MFAASKTAKAASAAAATDPQFPYVTMLLHGDGTNGAQNNTFLDSSTNNFTITRNGNTTQGTFTPYGSNWSNYFDGSSAKVTLSSSTAMNLDAQFTIECWVYWNGTSLYYQNFVGSNDTFTSNASFFRVWGTSAPVNANKIGIGNPTHDGSSSVFSTNNLVANKWNHVAATRDSSNIIRVFINGTLEKTGSTDSSVYNFGQGGTCIGDSPWDGAQGWYSGYISNLRIIKGSCLYTSSFTPSTTPLTAVTNTSLLVCQSNRFIDNSTNAFTLTVSGSPSVQRFSPFSPTTAYSTSVIGGSGYFDGSGDYLGFPNNTAFDFSTGDFTVEAWVYRVGTGSGSQAYEAIIGGNTSGVSYWTLYVNSSNNTVVWYGNDSTLRSTSNTITNNTWNHVAVSRSSGTLKIFINGVQGYSASVSTSYSLGSGGGGIGLDSASTGNKYFYGYINDTRVVKGTALYTSAFTPPTAPLTAVSGTSLLTNFTNAGIFDNAMMNDLETVGNAQISTSVKKYGTGSMYFDGTGDGLQAVGTPNTVFGTGDFTVEFWIYLNANTGTFKKFIELGTTGSCFTIETQGTSNVLTVTDLNNTVFLTSSSALSLTTWVHVAVTRSGSTLKLFQDGTQVGSATNSTNFANSGSVYIGQSNSGQAINAYMDDLRITKGYARYTSNFTPPTAAFPNN